MEIKQLKSFVTVAECGSFSKAAQILYISQPSISTHVSMLEQETGIKLIERTSKSLYLTEEGREFYDHAVNILKISDKMLNGIGGKAAPCIHIGASTVPSAYLLPDIIADYYKENPGCTFSVIQSDSRKVIDGITDGIFDVGFVGMPCYERGLTSMEIAEDKMVIILPDNEHFRSLTGSIGKSRDDCYKTEEKELFKKLLREPFILREDGSGSGEIFKKLMNYCEIPEKGLNAVARVNDHEAIINMVERGIGAACISSLALLGEQHRKVIRITLPEDIAGRQFYIVYKSGATKKQPVGDFIGSVSRKHREWDSALK